MKLLFITQKVDKNDSILGTYHQWIEEFSKHCESVTVICLYKGEHNLPNNVKVLSLGKEQKESRFQYLRNFYKYIWQERKNYDNVFVHMNQEYVLLAGLCWRLAGKKVFLWRNHRQGNLLTSIAVFISNGVFYTSPESYTARFKKSKIMPVGTNMEKFVQVSQVNRTPRSILSMGRISPIKNIEVFIKALVILEEKGVDFVSTIVGGPDEGQETYYENILKEGAPLVEKGRLVFKNYVANDKTPEMYFSHEFFVNLTSNGSMDKTTFSAMASGTLPIVSNTYFEDVLPKGFIFRQGDEKDLALKIESILEMSSDEKREMSIKLKQYVNDNHSLKAVVKKVLAQF